MAAKKKVAPSTATPMDETKRKFREALEAKQGRQAEGEAHLDTEASQVHAHGPVDAKRTFRRKTG
jgi:extradiol dioxygenase family protein